MAATSGRYSLPFHEAIQVALWDLAAKQQGLPLHTLLGSRRDKVRAYASGLDFHLTDDEFVAFFEHARSAWLPGLQDQGRPSRFRAGSAPAETPQQGSAAGRQIMIDANEAWGAKEAIVKLEAIRRAGFELLWVEDPILRNDFEGLRLLRRERLLDADQLGRVPRCRRQARS